MAAVTENEKLIASICYLAFAISDAGDVLTHRGFENPFPPLEFLHVRLFSPGSRIDIFFFLINSNR